MYRQLEIWWIDLNPTRGAETRKKRPCIIVQCDLMNRHSRTILVAPVLPGHKDWPFAVNLRPSKANGLDKNRHINMKQIRAVDISRIDDRQGILETGYLEAIQNTLGLVFGF
ncbi:MAG: type II toxin-antitoxin system PemK/MazF family toxin [Anaerolineae bacterium]|nr:type II toxin-antitoxin system PemK/MazF family toxin [Anaerolineae bacterium]